MVKLGMVLCLLVEHKSLAETMRKECSANAACATLSGDCCPTSDGFMLDCCHAPHDIVEADLPPATPPVNQNVVSRDAIFQRALAAQHHASSLATQQREQQRLALQQHLQQQQALQQQALQQQEMLQQAAMRHAYELQQSITSPCTEPELQHPETAAHQGELDLQHPDPELHQKSDHGEEQAMQDVPETDILAEQQQSHVDSVTALQSVIAELQTRLEIVEEHKFQDIDSPIQVELPVRVELPVQVELPIREELQEEILVPEELPVLEETLGELPVLEEAPVQDEELPVLEEAPVLEEILVPEELPVLEELIGELPIQDKLLVQEELPVNVTEEMPVQEEQLPVVEDTQATLPVVEELPVTEELPATKEPVQPYQGCGFRKVCSRDVVKHPEELTEELPVQPHQACGFRRVCLDAGDEVEQQEVLVESGLANDIADVEESENHLQESDKLTYGALISEMAKNIEAIKVCDLANDTADVEDIFPELSELSGFCYSE